MEGIVVSKRPAKWFIVGFATAIVMFFGVSWLTYRNTEKLVLVNDDVAATHLILEHIAQLRILLDEAESSSRGFALSGRSDYLEPFENARSRVEAVMRTLKQDLVNRSSALQSLSETEPLLSERLNAMEELIAARREGGIDAAISIVQRDPGKRLTEEITARLFRLQIDEQTLLLDNVRASDQRTRSEVYLVILASIMGLLLLIVTLLFINRSFHQQEMLRGALSDTERMQRAIIDGANYSIISTDASGLIRTINATGREWLRYAPEDLVSKSLTVLHDPQELKQRASQLAKSMGEPIAPDFGVLIAKARHGILDDLEWTYVRSDGSRFPVWASMTALRRQNGTISGYLAIANDLSRRRAIERMKDDFVSMVSHELRTPLTAIRGALGLLAGGATGKLPERAEAMVQTAVRNTERLTRLTNDILDLAQIESGRMTIVRKKSDVQELMKLSAELVQGSAKDAAVTILVQPVHHILEVDPDRMIQAFSNLLGNAIKFSPAGAEVVFGAAIDRNNVVFHVKDRGRGIPKEKIESIFGRFEQVDPSDSRNRGGTGLGLAICRSIVEQHGGRVWAESEVGEGSTFFVRLPLANHRSST
jgi:PAS domain S-box-containing protein